MLRTMNATTVTAFMGTSRSFLCQYDPAAFDEYCVGASTMEDGSMDRMLKMSEETGNLHTPHNFVRFVLPFILHFSNKVLHIDSDVIVKRDVADLYNALDSGYALAAVPRTDVTLGTYVTPTLERHRWIPLFSWPSFNAGVVVFNLAYLRGMQPSLLESVQALHAENADGAMWRHGSQPPLLLLFYDKVQWVDKRWNVDGLGYRNRTDVDDAFILHWTGPLKPWREQGKNKHLWNPFDTDCGHIATWAT